MLAGCKYYSMEDYSDGSPYHVTQRYGKEDTHKGQSDGKSNPQSIKQEDNDRRERAHIQGND